MDERELLNLKNRHQKALEGMKNAMDARKSATTDDDRAKAQKDFDAKRAEAADLVEQIKNYEDLSVEKGRFGDDDAEKIALAQQKQKEKEEAEREKSADDIRAEPEYAKVWVKALRSGMGVKKSRSVEDFAILHKALTVSGGTVSGEDGGFLVPKDFDNMIITEVKDYLDLSALFNTETVSAPTGWRAVEVAGQRTKLPLVGENTAIGKNNQPKFTKVDYSIKKYGDRLVVSSELMEDNTAGLMQYLAAWFAPKYILTKNDLLLSILRALPFVQQTATTDKDKVKAIKGILNKSLNTAYSRGAKLLMNQNVYDEMDNWVDGNNRPMLVPDVSGEFSRFKNRTVVYGDNDEIGTVTQKVESVDTIFDPLFIGDFKAAGTLFVKKAIEIAATDIGGDAWANDAYELRCLCRMDAQSVDKSAVVATGYKQQA